MEGLAHQLRNSPGIVDLRHPFGEGSQHPPIVDLLEGFAPQVIACHLADEEDEGRGILIGRMEADAGIGRARAAGDEADPWSSGQLAVGVGHHAGAALLAAGNEADPIARLIEGIEGCEITFPRHTEGHVGAVDQQLVDQDPPAAAAGEDGRHLFSRANAITSAVGIEAFAHRWPNLL